MDAIVIPVDSDRDQDDCPAINMDDINNEISLPSEDDLMNDGLLNSNKIIEPLEVPLDENKESNQSVSQTSVDKDSEDDFQVQDSSQKIQENFQESKEEIHLQTKDNTSEGSHSSFKEDSLFKLAHPSKTSIRRSNQTSQSGNDPLFSLGHKQSYDPLGFEEGSSVILLENPSEKFNVVKILYRPTQPGVVSGYLVAIKSQESGSIQWRDSNHILPAL